MKLSEEKMLEIVTYLDETLEPVYEDTSFAHEFGTQVQGYWYAELDGKYTKEEIEYACIESCYEFSHSACTLVYNSEYEMFLES